MLTKTAAPNTSQHISEKTTLILKTSLTEEICKAALTRSTATGPPLPFMHVSSSRLGRSHYMAILTSHQQGETEHKEPVGQAGEPTTKPMPRPNFVKPNTAPTGCKATAPSMHVKKNDQQALPQINMIQHDVPMIMTSCTKLELDDWHKVMYFIQLYGTINQWNGLLFKHDFSLCTVPILKDDRNKQLMKFRYAIPWVRIHNR